MALHAGGKTAAERGIQTRERLLAATVRLLASAGWGGVTTRAVAEQAGLNPGAVHYHFASVDELRRAAVRRCLVDLTAASMERLRSTADVVAGARAALDVVFAAERADPTLSIVLFEAFLGAQRDETLRAELAGLLRDTRAEFAAWLADHTDRDDALAVAALVLAALDGIYLHRLIDPEVDPAALTAPLHRLLGDAMEEGEQR